MLIKLLNIDKKDIVCRVNKRRVQLKKGSDGVTYVNLVLEEGKHLLEIVQKTAYCTPLCYLNVFNPIFFIYQLRFLEHRLNPRKNFSLTSFIFEVCNKNEANIILNMSQKTSGTIECIEKTGVKDSLICKQSQDCLQIHRYKKTHIYSSIFYMILFNILCIVEGFSNGKISETFVFCILISLFSIGNIRRINTQ